MLPYKHVFLVSLGEAILKERDAALQESWLFRNEYVTARVDSKRPSATYLDTDMIMTSQPTPLLRYPPWK